MWTRQTFTLLLTAPAPQMDRRSFLISVYAAGLVAAPSVLAADPNDHAQSVSVIADIFEGDFFDPNWMSTPEARSVFSDLESLAKEVADPEQFCRAFEQRFARVGLSHVALSVQRRPAAELGQYFDSMEVGPDAVDLTWNDKMASLSIRTIMGIDTGPRISAAFEEIVSEGATGLIIDLRDNPGGAFAMRHLVGHCITEAADAGVLLSQGWYAENERPPEPAEIESVTPWPGNTVVGLWDHLATHPITRVQFSPMQPNYGGPIAILINGRTESAAELVAEVLQSARGAILIGEPSAGAMLVQRPIDVTDRFTLFLPVADYVSQGSGRIEGSGLVPDMDAAAERAPFVASSILNER
tara:strand:- start:126 stop:1190 length:1065 start_codon:yes stop_codon:yes gene_type:complete